MNERRDWAPVDWSPMKRLIYLRGACKQGEGIELPPGYTRIEKISNPNSAYIDTGAALQYGSKITLCIETKAFPNANRVQYGWRWDGTYATSTQFYINSNYTTNRTDDLIIAGVGAEATGVNDFIMGQKTIFVFDTGSNSITVNNSDFNRTHVCKKGFNNSGSSVYAPYILALNNKGTPAAVSHNTNVYYYKVEYNGAVIQHMIPCISPNNEYGLYDVIREQFFGSANGQRFDG